MTALISPTPKLQFFDSNGDPLVNAKLYTYAAGTNTLLATYTSSTGGTPNANPVRTDARGECSVWLGTSLYKFVLYTSADALIWTVDNIGGAITAASITPLGLDTIAAFEAFSVGPAVTAVTVNGYYAAGDGGAGVYIRTGSVGPGAGMIQSDDGQWWILASSPVTLEMFGAKGDGSTLDTTAVNAAFSFGKPITVSAKTFLCNALTMQSGLVLRGSGDDCVIKNNSPGSDFMECAALTGIDIEGVCLDGGYTSSVVGSSWTIRFGTGVNSFQPVDSASRVANCLIKTNGFGALNCYNAGGVKILNNRVTGLTDTGIGLIAGCWDNVIDGNTVSGFLYPLGLSSQGYQHVATTGPVQGNIAVNNVLHGTKATGACIELDGLSGNIISNNTCIVDGTTYGIFLLCYNGVDCDIPIYALDNIIQGNVIKMVNDDASAAFNISGGSTAVDATSNVIDGNVMYADSTQATTFGYYVSLGASVRLSNIRCDNIGQQIHFEQNNLVGVSFDVYGGVVRGGAFGLYAASTDANKAAITLNGVDIQDAGTNNVAVDSGANLKLFNTPLNGSNYINPNTLGGDALQVVGGSVTPGLIASGASYVDVVAFPKAAVGATVTVGWSTNLSSCFPFGYCSVAGQVVVGIGNLTGAGVTFGSAITPTIRVLNPN